MIADVIGVGSRCPLGLSSMQVAMCARARKFEPRSLRHVKDSSGREVGACVSGGLSIHQYGYARLVSLAVPAITEACVPALGDIDPRGEVPIPVVLSLAETSRPNDDERLATSLVSDLAERTRLNLDTEQTHALRLGHAGGAYALVKARELLDAGAPMVLVGGIDSYFDPQVLRWLEEELRLHAPHIDDGFIPSEGAAFTLLTRSGNLPAGATMPPSRARLCHVFCELETAERRGVPNTAEAVTKLVDEAKARGPVHWLLSDVNGEHHRVKEWSLLKVRQQLMNDFTEDRLVGELGDVGAASAPMLLNIACEYWRAACAPASRAAVLVCSEGEERGLVLAEAAT